jgi:aminoglycoside/choline kinase family phosphotransferase
MDLRLDQLNQWLHDTAKIARFDLQPASADASFRRYFRVTFDGKTLIAMDAPPEREDSAKYIRLARLLHRVGLHVPAIIEADLAAGFLLVTDLGNTQYLQVLSVDTVDRLYGDALDALLHMQTSSVQDIRALPPYDDALLTRELGIFDEWFLGRHLGIALDGARRDVLDAAYGALKRSALEQPTVCVHRDYHSRNLMLTPERNPGVLDFQDAVYGPITYDLASLLRDCYIAWPRERVVQWAELHRRRLAERGARVDDAAQFLRWFDLMGTQRHLKAIGIFARLNHRDGKPGYLGDIPRTLGYVMDVCGRYPELRELQGMLQRDVAARV